MPDTDKLEVIQTSQVHDTDVRGNVITKFRIVWRMGEKHGPFIDYFPTAQFTAASARQELENKARELRILDA